MLITLRNLISSLTSGLLIQPQFWQKVWQVFAYWHSSKYDQVSDLGQQLGAWSGLLISLLAKFNLFHLTSQMKQGVIDVKMNKSNFDEKSSKLNCVGALTVFLLLKLPVTKLNPCFVSEVSFFGVCLLFL